MKLCIASRVDTGMFRPSMLLSIGSESEDLSYSTHTRSESESCTSSTPLQELKIRNQHEEIDDDDEKEQLPLGSLLGLQNPVEPLWGNYEPTQTVHHPCWATLIRTTIACRQGSSLKTFQSHWESYFCGALWFMLPLVDSLFHRSRPVSCTEGIEGDRT